MPDITVHKLQEIVKLNAPPEATGYCFQRLNSDNVVLRYPSSGCWKLVPFAVPYGVPNGMYTVCYFRLMEDRLALPPKNPSCLFPQVPFYGPTGDDAPPQVQAAGTPTKDNAGAAVATVPASTTDEIRRLRAELHAELERTPAMRDTRIEYMQRQLALELQEQNQDLVKHSHYVAEVGGQFQLNRAYRVESQQAMETVLGLAKRTAEDAQNMMSVFRGMQDLQVEALVSIKKQVTVLACPPPPPPPPDYSGAATAAVNLLRDVSVALIQLKGGQTARPAELPPANRGDLLTAELHTKGTGAGSSLPAPEPPPTTSAVAQAVAAPSPPLPMAAQPEVVATAPAAAVTVAPSPAAAIDPAPALTPPAPIVAAGDPMELLSSAVISEASAGSQLVEQLAAVAAEYQRLDARADAGEALDASVPVVQVAKVEVQPSPLVSVAAPVVAATATTLDPTGPTKDQATRRSSGTGWLDMLRWMFSGQRAAIEESVSALRGRRKE